MKTTIPPAFQRIVLLTGTLACLTIESQAAAIPVITKPANNAKITTSSVDIGVSVAGIQDVQSVKIRSGTTVIGSATPTSLFGEWSFPDGSHISVMEGSTADDVLVDYNPPHPSQMFMMDGSFTAANNFTGTFSHWNGVDPEPVTGTANLAFSFTNAGLLNVAIAGASPLGNRNVNGGLSQNETYHFVWNNPPAGSHPLTAVVTYLTSGGGATETVTSSVVKIMVEAAQSPEIVVQQPVGSGLTDGKTKKSFGTVTVGKSGKAKTFTIKNTGTAKLTGLAITKKGANAKDFVVTDPEKTSLLPGASTTFKVTFKPKAKGVRNAAIHIKSNDADENPFDIDLTGAGAKP